MKILNCILTLGCLGGMVSCYPVAANQNANSQRKVSANSPAVDANKKEKKKKPSYHDVTTPDYGATATAGVNGVTDASATVDATGTPSVDNKPAEENKPTTPPVVKIKTAKKVPNREGFVFNPYTYNQVDVRGIPSGTKVRDPHDSNPAHVFKVP